jgi:hypothetical protein
MAKEEDRSSKENGVGSNPASENAQVKIRWDSSGVRSAYANVFNVTAVREEIMLLFGESHSLDKDEKGVRLTNRILLNPFTAKRMLTALQNAIEKNESTYGPVDKKVSIQNRQRTVPPLRLPPFESVEAAERVGLLFELLKNLDLRVGFERSFKVLEKTLLANRFLLAFKRASIKQNPHEKILDICVRMSMPKTFLETFEQNLPEATLVGFGIEEDEATCVVKAYLEFRNRYEEAIRKKPSQPDPYVSHLGFKWDAADNTRGALARYTCFPAFTAGDIAERLSETFYQHPERKPFEIIKGVIDLASKKVGRDKFLYLEVNEENNPRSSFDINMYGANFRLEEVYPFFLEMCRHYSIPDEQFHCLYDPVRTRTFGHVAGGRDRKGRDFLTVYFGE